MQNQRGNVLFLVLIAVTLFAALSYAVTQSTRSGGGDVSSEKTRMIVSNFYNIFSQVDAAYTRLQVSGGCSDAEIGFDVMVNNPAGAALVGNSVMGDGTVTDQASQGYVSGDLWGYARRGDGTCDLFSPSGGGVLMTITRTPDNHLQMFDSGFLFFQIDVLPYAAQSMTASNDLIMAFWIDASDPSESAAFTPICEMINEDADVSNPNSGLGGWSGAGLGDFWGKRTFCVNNPGVNVAIYHVVAER